MSQPLDRTGATPRARIAMPCLLVCALGAGVFCAWEEAGAATGAALRSALAAAGILPLLLALHLVQAACSTEGWRTVIDAGAGGRAKAGSGRSLSFATLLRLRVLREALDTLLPVPAIAGELLAGAELARGGMRRTDAAAAIGVDIAAEFAGQIVFLVPALAAASIVAPFPGASRDTALAAALLAALACSLAVAARGTRGGSDADPPRVASALLRRLAPGARGLSDDLREIERAGFARLADRRAFAVATGWHAAHWALGAVETALCLAAIGLAFDPLAALALNGLGIAARSVGVVVPGSLGVQEGGYALAGALLGLPVEAALAVSLLRRGREFGFALLCLPLLRWGRQESVLRAPLPAEGAA